MNGAREETENNNNSKHNNSKYLFLYDNDIKRREQIAHIVLVVEKREKKLLLVLSFEQKESVFLSQSVECFYFEQLLLIHHKLMENFTLTQPNRFTHTYTNERILVLRM